MKHPDIRGVSFTGGTVTGKRIAAAGAATLKKMQLELGGKNPAIVFNDCYFDETVAGILRAGLTNTVSSLSLSHFSFFIPLSCTPDTRPSLCA